jgi:nitrate/nitrite transporter NarK
MHMGVFLLKPLGGVLFDKYGPQALGEEVGAASCIINIFAQFCHWSRFHHHRFFVFVVCSFFLGQHSLQLFYLVLDSWEQAT